MKLDCYDYDPAVSRMSSRVSRAGRRVAAARPGWLVDAHGQSLVELAIALPLLLVLLLGVADLGRAFVYSAIVTNAAREAAVYAARTPTATSSDVRQRACDETGIVAYGDRTACALASDLAVTCSRGSNPCLGTGGGGNVTVEVRYQFRLLSSYLAERVFGSAPLAILGRASMPGLSE